MNPLSAVYGRVARFRRHWYEERPHLRHQLGCPVVSVGNLVMGGSGKTPVVAALAALLRDAGYVPAILSRGYKRRDTASDVVVVSDGAAIRAGVEASGDEPQLLARRLPDVRVVVSADRVRAGIVARDQLGANVMILDDGFQHFQMGRTVDLLMVSADDVREPVFPGGRLREPLDAARRADAVLVAGAGDPSRIGAQVGVRQAFSVRTSYQPLRTVVPFGGDVGERPRRVVALAAIARPERFVDAVRALGYEIVQQITFRDHHWFDAADAARIEEAARASGADAVVTTEKDAVRLERVVTGSVPFAFLPIDAHVEPADDFRNWLLSRLSRPGG